MSALPTPTGPVLLPRSTLERAQGEFLAGNHADAAVMQVRPLVRESWERSLRSSVGTDRRPVLELTGDALESYRLAHPLAGGLALIRSLLLPGEDDESGVVVAVGDAAGRLLWIEGDRRMRHGAADMGFVEGANWSEEQIGTAAPGTALALGRSVQVRRGEHFNRLVQPWSCSAAPVRDPETGSIIGVIDVTGGDVAATPQAKMLVDATVRAVEGELLIARMRSRTDPVRKRWSPSRRSRRDSASERATLSVFGRDRALLQRTDAGVADPVEVGIRHAEILLVLSAHPGGLSADRLAELVYGDHDAVGTLRPELVRLRKVLQQVAPQLVPESRPYRLPAALETDVQHVHSLLRRGAHRVALAAVHGDILPGSTAPGIDDLRRDLAEAIHEAMMSEASVEVLLDYLDTDLGADDAEAARQALTMLPPRSPKRAALVARIERLS